MNAQRPADDAAILEMRVEFLGRLVDGALRRAAQLELPARLERNAANRQVAQPDRVAPVEERLPPGPRRDAVEQRMHALIEKDYDAIKRLTGLTDGQFATNHLVRAYDE